MPVMTLLFAGGLMLWTSKISDQTTAGEVAINVELEAQSACLGVAANELEWPVQVLQETFIGKVASWCSGGPVEFRVDVTPSGEGFQAVLRREGHPDTLTLEIVMTDTHTRVVSVAIDEPH
jgi:hypothetical protein